jgi:hypothetical protein
VLTLLQRNSSVLQVPKSPRNTDESRARWRDEGKRLVRAFGAQHVNLEALDQRPGDIKAIIELATLTSAPQ